MTTSAAKTPTETPAGVWVCRECGAFFKAQTNDGRCRKLTHASSDRTTLVWTPVPREIMERYIEMRQLMNLANLCGPPPGTTLAFFRTCLDRCDELGWS